MATENIWHLNSAIDLFWKQRIHPGCDTVHIICQPKLRDKFEHFPPMLEKVNGSNGSNAILVAIKCHTMRNLAVGEKNGTGLRTQRSACIHRSHDQHGESASRGVCLQGGVPTGVLHPGSGFACRGLHPGGGSAYRVFCIQRVWTDQSPHTIPRFHEKFQFGGCVLCELR